MLSAYFPAEAPMLPLAPDTEVPPPPGLLGELARFIFDAAPRPVPEIAIAGAIGFLAGIAGRAFNVYGTGLNQYVLLIADTGTGKEAIKAGIDRLVGALTDPASGSAYSPFAATFVGPADMASGQGLLKAVAGRTPPSFVSIMGEFGLRFKQMAHERANAADTSLLRTMLDFYNKSGQGQIVGETVYSDREKNTGAILAPAVSFIGESTPDTFYGNLDDKMIANGLLPRFTIIEYQGKRPRWNRTSEHVRPPSAMLERTAKLIATSYEANIGNKAIRVEMMPDAEACLDELDAYADDQINGSRQSVTRELWNRAHIKAAKLAALIAVGCNEADAYRRPIVTLDMAKWARCQIERDIRRLLDRFESGEVGEAAGDEVKQQNAVLRCVFEYLDQRQPFDRFAKYGVIAEMRADGVFTQSYLSRRVLKLPAFSEDRMGATNALKRVLANLIDADDIRELPRRQVADRYYTTARAFAVSNPARFYEAGGMKVGAPV
jgi:hypothetical protein